MKSIMLNRLATVCKRSVRRVGSVFCFKAAEHRSGRAKGTNDIPDSFINKKGVTQIDYTSKKYFDAYKKREKIWDKKYTLLFKNDIISKSYYDTSKHYFALGVFD